ncbi:MAG: hypothetical protein HY736_23920 [Verrucomicrobia bacterium]|nr:hypothetical protein [Verrucomicrobiota bacterium]
MAAFGDRAVVAVVPEQRVVGDAQFPQAGAKLSHRAVHRRELGEEMLRWLRLAGVKREVAFRADVGRVRRSKPHDGEERLAARLRPADEFERPLHDDLRALTGSLHCPAVVGHPRIHLEKVWAG